MAKFQSTLIEQASGKLGENIVMRQTATGKILCKAPKKASTPRRSEKQAYTRLQMANLLANYRLYSGKLAEAFESKRAGAERREHVCERELGARAGVSDQTDEDSGCVRAGGRPV